MLYHILVEFHKDFVLVDSNQITVGIKSKPVDGEANRKIIKKLAKYFCIPSASIIIKSGHKSSKKIIEII